MNMNCFILPVCCQSDDYIQVYKCILIKNAITNNTGMDIAAKKQYILKRF